MDKYKKLASNTLIFAIGTFSSKILSFLLMPFVTRMMGTGDYGSADLVQQTVNVLIPVVTLQVNSAALRFALDKAVDKSDVFKVGVRTTLAGFAVFLLFTYPLSKLTINDFHLGDYIILIVSFVLVSSFRQLCQQFVRGSGHVKLYALDGILATATTLAFTILFLGPFKWGVTGYIVAIIASDACSVVFYFVTAKLYRYINFNKLKDNSITSQMLKYCVPLIPTIILWWIINVSDRYMVTYFISSSANGLYTAASKIPNFVVRLMNMTKRAASSSLPRCFVFIQAEFLPLRLSLFCFVSLLQKYLLQNLIMIRGSLFLFLLLPQRILVLSISLPQYIWRKKRMLCLL